MLRLHWFASVYVQHLLRAALVLSAVCCGVPLKRTSFDEEAVIRRYSYLHSEEKKILRLWMVHDSHLFNTQCVALIVANKILKKTLFSETLLWMNCGQSTGTNTFQRFWSCRAELQRKAMTRPVQLWCWCEMFPKLKKYDYWSHFVLHWRWFVVLYSEPHRPSPGQNQGFEKSKTRLKTKPKRDHFQGYSYNQKDAVFAVNLKNIATFQAWKSCLAGFMSKNFVETETRPRLGNYDLRLSSIRSTTTLISHLGNFGQ